MFVQNSKGSIALIITGGSAVIPPLSGIFDLSFDNTFA